MISGGSGNDTFNITTNNGSPTIIWGGDGADTINLAAGVNSSEGPAGILVVNVAGLPEENFHLFDIEQLGLGANFDWGQIDAILINPDATDRVMIEGNLLQAQQETQTIGGQYYVLNGEPHNPNNYEVVMR